MTTKENQIENEFINKLQEIKYSYCHDIRNLSSLDNLIEAQNKKIETLKEHKKGLMQQLFVSREV